MLLLAFYFPPDERGPLEVIVESTESQEKERKKRRKKASAFFASSKNQRGGYTESARRSFAFSFPSLSLSLSPFPSQQSRRRSGDRHHHPGGKLLRHLLLPPPEGPAPALGQGLPAAARRRRPLVPAPPRLHRDAALGQDALLPDHQGVLGHRAVPVQAGGPDDAELPQARGRRGARVPQAALPGRL